MLADLLKGHLHKLLSCFTGVIATLLVLELLFRMLPVDTGLRMQPVDASNPVMRSVPGQTYVSSTGWALSNVRVGVTNNYGFVNPIDYRSNSHPVAVIGDSYIEARMNSFPDTLQGRLAKYFNGVCDIYSMGMSGASLSDYLVISEYAKQNFAPRAMIFLIVHGDAEESVLTPNTPPVPGNSYFVEKKDGSLELYKTPYHSSTLKELARKSALIRYIFLNLKLDLSWKDILYSSKVAGDNGPRKNNLLTPRGLDRAKSAITKFLDELPHASGLETGKIVFIVDADRNSLYAKYITATDTGGADDDKVSHIFVNEAEARGYRVIEMRPVFESYLAQNKKKVDYSPLDSHWNRVAHELAARAAYPVLKDIIATPASTKR